MTTTSYANLEPYEGTISGSLTITFDLKPRRITIINDSGSNELHFKFASTKTFATLKPTETVTLDIGQRELFLSGNGEYRIWGLG